MKDEEVHNPLAGHWITFRSWHGEPSFWREVYARTFATLCAALVVYVVAALAGLVDTKPLSVVGIILLIITTPPLVYLSADMIAHWKDLRMSRDWSLTPPRNDSERRIRLVYERALPIGLVWTFGMTLLVATLTTR